MLNQGFTTFFKTPDGEKLISLKYGLFKSSPKKELTQCELFDQKFGEDIEINKNKNKSIKDFLT